MVKLNIAITSDFYGSRQEDGSKQEDSSKQEIMSPERFSWIESEHLKFELEHSSHLSNKTNTLQTRQTNRKGNYYSIKQRRPQLKPHNHCRLLSRASLRKHNAVKQYRRHRVAYIRTLFQKPLEIKTRQMEVMNSTYKS